MAAVCLVPARALARLERDPYLQGHVSPRPVRAAAANAGYPQVGVKLLAVVAAAAAVVWRGIAPDARCPPAAPAPPVDARDHDRGITADDELGRVSRAETDPAPDDEVLRPQYD